MAAPHKTIPFEEFVANASAIFDELASGSTVVVERGGGMYSLSERRARRRRKTGVIEPGDSMFDMMGMVSTTGPTDVSANKHQYLADAYVDHGRA